MTASIKQFSDYSDEQLQHIVDTAGEAEIGLMSLITRRMVDSNEHYERQGSAALSALRLWHEQVRTELDRRSSVVESALSRASGEGDDA